MGCYGPVILTCHFKFCDRYVISTINLLLKARLSTNGFKVTLISRAPGWRMAGLKSRAPVPCLRSGSSLSVTARALNSPFQNECLEF